jgi:mannitol-specific phosphotransferase system IIBC component
MNKTIRYLRALLHFPIGVFIILAIIIIGVFLMINRSDIELRRIEFVVKPDYTEMDTIETYPNKKLYLVNLVRYGTFGRFSVNYAVMKNVKNGKSIIYEFPEKGNGEYVRVSASTIFYTLDKSQEIINKYDKAQIISTIDSVTKLSDPPERITFKALNKK